MAPGFRRLAFEVRYRIKSWQVLDLASRTPVPRREVEPAGALVGFSMGGAVSIAAADEPRVTGVLGLAPWIPDRLDVGPLRGKRLDVLHGSLDRSLPGIPRVSASLSRRGFERARALGVPGSYTLIRGGVHGLALRFPGGRLIPLPRASTWARLVAAQLDTFAG
jgi:dienelactone hydrolase